jgi:tetraacyldisaccharide 4'-kinase
MHKAWVLRQPRYRARVPVIVVGNVTAGGTGKTPVCLALAKYFTDKGSKVVLVSRGYGGQAERYPLLVAANTDPAVAGDEAVLLAQQSGCAVVVDPQRVRAVQYAERELQAQLIISDDGLQHHPLQGWVELAVVDGSRGLGNGLLLPAGPLREPATRLASVDAVVSTGALAQPLSAQPRQLFVAQLAANHLVNLGSGERLGIGEWQARRAGDKRVHAVAGIGNPQRFFTSLQQQGFVIMPHAFDDHHAYVADDLAFADQAPVVMTSKDAVKCRRFAQPHWWALEVEPQLPPDFFAAIETLLNGLHNSLHNR